MKNSMNLSRILGLVFGLVITTGAIIFVLVLFNSSKKETEVHIREDAIEIVGMYGSTYDFDSITSVELMENIPTIISKINGAGLGEIKKGEFKLEEWGNCRLFIHTQQGPYIVFVANDKRIIINFYQQEDTIEVYQDLIAAWE